MMTSKKRKLIVALASTVVIAGAVVAYVLKPLESYACVKDVVSKDSSIYLVLDNGDQLEVVSKSKSLIEKFYVKSLGSDDFTKSNFGEFKYYLTNYDGVISYNSKLIKFQAMSLKSQSSSKSNSDDDSSHTDSITISLDEGSGKLKVETNGLTPKYDYVYQEPGTLNLTEFEVEGYNKVKISDDEFYLEKPNDLDLDSAQCNLNQFFEINDLTNSSEGGPNDEEK